MLTDYFVSHVWLFISITLPVWAIFLRTFKSKEWHMHEKAEKKLNHF